MDAKVKEMWLKALRSGEYKQGREHLRQGNHFCCLGVLCDLHQENTPSARWSEDDTYNGSDGILPRPVMQWAGLDSFDPCLDGKYVSEMNDEGATFLEIADKIEAHL